MSAGFDLVGQVQLRPGTGHPTLTSTRPALVGRLTQGRRPEELPLLLGSLFTLCGHAHQLAAQMAVDAALGRASPSPAPAAAAALRVATARDQLVRIAHDWPRLLPGTPDEALAQSLVHCPLGPALRDPVAQQSALAALPAWLEQHWLGLPAAEWLARQEQAPVEWAMHWARNTTTPLARLLRAQHGPCARLATPALPLSLAALEAGGFKELSRQLEQVPPHVLPQWQGAVPDTGPWTRRRDSAPLPAHNAWMRLLSRLTDLLHLAVPDGPDWLALGRLQPAPGQGIAWVEMARGLLIHWVKLSDGPGGPRVAACRVLAPTDWNFHPHGVLAHALAGVTHEDDARRLAVAFDPCVAFSVEMPQATAQESPHA